jgi:hypothetical protein
MSRLFSFSARLSSSLRLISPVLGIAAVSGLCGCSAGFVLLGSGGGTSTPATAVSNGPQLGYAWYAQDQTLRPILGVPGSSQFGESVVPAGAYVGGASSAAANLALLIGTDEKVYKMSLPNGTPTQIGATAGTGAVVRFSPTGASAVVYVPGGTSATLVTGVRTTPVVKTLSMTAPLLEMTASDAGTAAAVLQGSHGASVAVVSGTNARQIAAVNGDGGISFAGTSEDLVVADSVANSLTLIRAAATAPVAVQLETASLLKTPMAVGASLNGKWVVVANSGESSVVRVDVSGASAPQRVSCPTQPTVVAQLAGNGVFRFNDLGATSVWLSDVTTASPSMLFIPALPSTQARAETSSTVTQ